MSWVRQEITIVQLSPEDVVFLWELGIRVESPDEFVILSEWILELGGVRQPV